RSVISTWPVFRAGRSGSTPTAANKKRRGNNPRRIKIRSDWVDYIPTSNTFGICASGRAATPTMVATSVFRVRLLQRLPRIWAAIHSSTSVSTLTALVGPQLSIEVAGDSATVRGGTGRPDTEAA